MDETDKRIADGVRVLRQMGDRSDSSIGGVNARETVHDELGFNGPRFQLSRYDLDDATRDVLIVHGRQDAAHAMANSATILRRLAQLSGLVRLMALVWLATLVLVALLAAGSVPR